MTLCVWKVDAWFQASQKVAVCKDIEEKLSQELVKVRKPMEEAYKTLEKCLLEGVEKSKSSCGEDLKAILHPPVCIWNITWNLSHFAPHFNMFTLFVFLLFQDGRGFHKILKCVVTNNGKYNLMNLNVTLASSLTDSIDEEFRKTFP